MLRRFAPRNDAQIRLGIPAAQRARVLQIFPPMRAWGMPGAKCTRSLACEFFGNAHERSHHRFTGTSRHSRTRMVLTGSSVLSPATNSSCHRRLRINGFVAPGWARKNLRKLSTNNGCQDHTASPSTSASFVLRTLGRSRGSSRPATPNAPDAVASTASCPNVRDDGQRPSSGQDGGSASADLPDGLSGIFLQRGMDRIH